jgi:septum formation protein
MSDKEPLIILASASPRRSELLAAIGLRFDVDPSRIEERPHQGGPIAEYTMALARAKAADVARRRNAGLVIAADTVVAVNGQVLGKPQDEEDARRMLRLLSGRWHKVITGVALLEAESGRGVEGCEETDVKFASLDERQMDWYIATGEPFDKAGAYAIQERASLFVEEVRGNYHNVVGLPIPLVLRLAEELGYSLLTKK